MIYGQLGRARSVGELFILGNFCIGFGLVKFIACLRCKKGALERRLEPSPYIGEL